MEIRIRTVATAVLLAGLTASVVIAVRTEGMLDDRGRILLWNGIAWALFAAAAWTLRKVLVRAATALVLAGGAVVAVAGHVEESRSRWMSSGARLICPLRASSLTRASTRPRGGSAAVIRRRGPMQMVAVLTSGFFLGGLWWRGGFVLRRGMSRCDGRLRCGVGREGRSAPGGEGRVA
ncbi:hypothetical protein [Streptomyces sp. 2A115]|uniref:hypothetical protein n=1 Tax=Streptomyces sp. 2A115 TaxID=3457439 RepID=UPI003FD4FE67